jgi:NAD(P)-dependent dehydrogenase (short-subunit alcohol dehydrogenase family)
MRPGVTFGELTLLCGGAGAAVPGLGEASHFLVLERRDAAAEHATVELATGGDPMPRALPSPAAAVFAFIGSAPPELTLGRSSESDIEIDDPAVSKIQLCFRREGQATTVRDSASHNGTKLNGTRLEPNVVVSLRDGDVLDIAERYRATFLGAQALLARLKDAATRSESSNDRRGGEAAEAGILAGKVAVVTGAGRGLGRAYALRFAEEGCRVVVNDVGAAPDGTGRDADVAHNVVSEIARAGGTALASLHDVSLRTEVDALFALAKHRFDGVDILVCSAGALHAGSSVLEMDDEIWDRLMLINARSTFLCVRAAARMMTAQRRSGRIITTSSMAAMHGNAGLVGYAASKAAIYALSQTAALELAPNHITVNTLTPMAWTRLTSTVPAIAAIPNAEQVLSARYVADVALFLASDLAADVTGQVVDVGGPQLSFYKINQTVPVLPGGARWTPHELRRRWQELTNA